MKEKISLDDVEFDDEIEERWSKSVKLVVSKILAQSINGFKKFMKVGHFIGILIPYAFRKFLLMEPVNLFFYHCKSMAANNSSLNIANGVS